jgi:rhodanese-related sulfurtransferase
MSLDEYLVRAQQRIRRFTPEEAHRADRTLVDIRSQDAREREGAIPGAYHVPRTVLEWRLASRTWKNPELDGRKLILVCDDGYSSVLAAAALVDLGLDCGDMVGGFRGWVEAGLPTTTPRVQNGLPGMGGPD